MGLSPIRGGPTLVGFASAIATVEMKCTRLRGDPELIRTLAGRRRIVEAVRGLYQDAAIEKPPYIEDGWIVIPEGPAVVLPALLRVAPDWVELFAL